MIPSLLLHKQRTRRAEGSQYIASTTTKSKLEPSILPAEPKSSRQWHDSRKSLEYVENMP
jgi:hypothetical protein